MSYIVCLLVFAAAIASYLIERSGLSTAQLWIVHLRATCYCLSLAAHANPMKGALWGSVWRHGVYSASIHD